MDHVRTVITIIRVTQINSVIEPNGGGLFKQGDNPVFQMWTANN